MSVEAVRLGLQASHDVLASSVLRAQVDAEVLGTLTELRSCVVGGGEDCAAAADNFLSIAASNTLPRPSLTRLQGTHPKTVLTATVPSVKELNEVAALATSTDRAADAVSASLAAFRQEEVAAACPSRAEAIISKSRAVVRRDRLLCIRRSISGDSLGDMHDVWLFSDSLLLTPAEGPGDRGPPTGMLPDLLDLSLCSVRDPSPTTLSFRLTSDEVDITFVLPSSRSLRGWLADLQKCGAVSGMRGSAFLTREIRSQGSDGRRPSLVVVKRGLSSSRHTVVYQASLPQLLTELDHHDSASAAELGTTMVETIPGVVPGVELARALANAARAPSVSESTVVTLKDLVRVWLSSSSAAGDFTPDVKTLLSTWLHDVDPELEAAVVAAPDGAGPGAAPAEPSEAEAVVEIVRSTVGSAFSRRRSATAAPIAAPTTAAELWSIEHVCDDPAEIATQLTQLMTAMRRLATVRDVVRFATRVMVSGGADVPAADDASGVRHIRRCIMAADRVTLWTGAEILQAPLSMEHRPKMVSKFIRIADECRKLNNFDTAHAIVKGLSLSCVAGLTVVWASVPAADKDVLLSLRKLFDPSLGHLNYMKAYEAVAATEPTLSVTAFDIRALSVEQTDESTAMLRNATTSFSQQSPLPMASLSQVAFVGRRLLSVDRPTFPDTRNPDFQENLRRCLSRAPPETKLVRLSTSILARSSKPPPIAPLPPS